MTSRVEWFDDRISAQLRATEHAHDEAVQEAADLAAAKVGGSGGLAGDVSRPVKVGPLESEVGSNRVYAAVQQRGGTIVPKNSRRLLIHAGGSGPIVASARYVRIAPKHYLEVARDRFHELVNAALKKVLP